MKAASIADIKKELKTKDAAALAAICSRLARYKKENKELLTYLLFESGDEAGYVRSAKEEIDAAFSEINTANLYWAKKGVRKVLRITNRFIKYSEEKETEVALRLHFCTALKSSGIQLKKSNALLTQYNNQRKKIEAVLAGLHEDIQHEYVRELARIELD